MVNYKLKVFTIPLAGLSKRAPILMPIYKAYVSIVLAFYSTKSTYQPSSVINDKFGGVHRSLQYFSYKSFYNNHLIELGGKTSWIKIDGALLIGDIELITQNEVEKMIRKIKSLAFWLGCNKVIFPVSKDTNWDNLLGGKVDGEEGIYVGDLDLQSGLPLEKFKYVFADFDTF